MTSPFQPRGRTVRALVDPDGDVLEPGKHEVRLKITGSTWFTFVEYTDPMTIRVTDPSGFEMPVGVAQVVEVRELANPPSNT